MDCTPACQTGDNQPAPVGTVERSVPERLDLGHAAPGPGWARRSAPSRDVGGSRGANLPTGLVAPASDGFRMSYLHAAYNMDLFRRRKIKYHLG